MTHVSVEAEKFGLYCGMVIKEMMLGVLDSQGFYEEGKMAATRERLDASANKLKKQVYCCNGNSVQFSCFQADLLRFSFRTAPVLFQLI